MTGEPDLVEALGEIIPWCQGTNELHARAIAEIERQRREIGILKALLAQYEKP